jgi:pSer/pThr/pTyr-binding forkhead associated (FHA) protein
MTPGARIDLKRDGLSRASLQGNEILSYIQSMALRIKAVSGPLKGKSYKLKAGLRIGRTKGDILLVDDGKVSSLHAFVTEVGNDFVLNDNGSKNGIRHKGDRVPNVVLKAGSTFQIGRTDFAVVSDSADVELPPETGSRVVASNPTIASPPITEMPTPAPKAEAPKPAEKTKPSVAEAPPEEEPTGGEPLPDEVSAVNAKPDAARRWNDVLAEIAIGALGNIKDQPRAVVALTPAVKLTFIGGVQAETRWILGYGPRRAGAASIDLPIFESGAPDVCFEIIPSPEGVTFRTNHPKEVTLNGEQLRVQSLKEGDMIAIGQTRIEVEFER